MKGIAKWLGAGGALLAALVLLVGIDLQDPPVLVRLAGRLHPLIVHFPIGLLLLALLFRLLALKGQQPGNLRDSADLIWDLGALSALAVALTGNALSLEGGFGEDLIYWHKRLGIGVAVASCGASLIRRLQVPGSAPWTALYYVLVAATSISLVAAGHLGGTMVHGAGYWSAYLPESVGRLVDPFAPRFGSESSVEFQQARIFPDLVVPVLNGRCTSCHGSTRHEAGLRLNSYEALLAGSNRGAALEAGTPDSSEIMRRVTASLADQDHMPPAGHAPLDIGETELLRWWINEGASKDLRIVDARELPPAVNTLLNRRFGYRDKATTGIYALEVSPLDPASMRLAREAGFGVRLVSRDHAFVQVDTTNLGGACDDEAIQVLKPMAEHVADLNLSRTGVGDAGLQLIASMSHLTRLNLSQTRVGDEGLGHLESLRYLEYLNLFGTPVSDDGLLRLRALPALKTLYVWQAGTTPEGLDRFRQQAPGIVVQAGLQLQPVAGEEEEP